MAELPSFHITHHEHDSEQIQFKSITLLNKLLRIVNLMDYK